jgi:hypothetical protein
MRRAWNGVVMLLEIVVNAAWVSESSHESEQKRYPIREPMILLSRVARLYD